MLVSFASSIPRTCFHACAQPFLPFVFPDEDGKAESTSEDKQPDGSQAQIQDRPQQQSSQPEASSGSSQVPGSGSLRKPDQPDLADRSSQSSFTSQDGTGKHNRGSSALKKHTPTCTLKVWWRNIVCECLYLNHCGVGCCIDGVICFLNDRRVQRKN